MSWSTTLKNRHQVRNQMEAGEEIAVMFSDIRGFTSYTARRGDHAAYQLSQLHTTLLKERIEEQDGFIVKTLGDGIMAAYPRAVKGIQAAVNIQQAIRERNKASSEDPIDIGIGLATGRPIMSNFDMIGHSVNLSQRVSSLAKGGQILVTEQIRQSTTIPEGFRYLSMGTRELKGLGAEQLYEVAWMAEVARISDKNDNVTLVLTKKGTVVVELAKAIQAELSTARTEARTGISEENGTLSRVLKQGISRFVQSVIDRSLTAIEREHQLSHVRLSLEGENMIVRLGKMKFSLENVDRQSAEAFLGKLDEIKKKIKK